MRKLKVINSRLLSYDFIATIPVLSKVIMKHLYLVFFISLFLINSGAGENIHMLPGSVKFIKEFDTIIVGMPTDVVKGILGNATSEENEKWKYFENRPPKPGEQLVIYEISFRDGRVTEKRKLPGACEVGMAPQAKSQLPVKMDVKLYYGRNYEIPSEKTKVLIQELTFRNSSKTETLNLSFWNNPLFIKSIQPTANYTLIKRLGPEPKISGPKKNSLVKIGPGEAHTIKSWSWPYATLPWWNETRTEYYKVQKQGSVSFEFCMKFSDDSVAYKNHLKMSDLKFSVGEVCSKKIDLDFKVLKKDENDDDDQ